MGLRFALGALILSLAAKAFAHGPPPVATALLGLEGEDVTLVSLTRGLAYRTGDGFRFVCPETWGGDVTAPSAGIPEGPAVVASDKLFIVEPDGRVSLHPNQVGVGIALASNRDALFGIFQREEHYELRRITQSTSDLVRDLDEPFAALAAGDSELSLLSWSQSTLVLQTILLSGELGERVSWSAPNAVSYAELRSAEDQLYVLIWGSAAPWVTLGRVTEHGYEKLAEAGSDIAGPVALAGSTFVERDGVFEPLQEGAMRVGRADYLTCLGSYVGLPYACAHGDLIRVDQDGLGAALFEMASLREPNYQGLAEAARMDCKARWLDLQDHLASAAQSNATPDAGGLEAGASASDAATSNDASEAGATHPDGCALGAGPVQAWWLNAILLVALPARRRRKERVSPAATRSLACARGRPCRSS